MSGERLKPCPFCGGKAVTHACAELENESARVIYSGKYGVHCSKCGVSTLPFPYEAAVIDVWNKRTIQTTPTILELEGRQVDGKDNP